MDVLCAEEGTDGELMTKFVGLRKVMCEKMVAAGARDIRIPWAEGDPHKTVTSNKEELFQLEAPEDKGMLYTDYVK